MPQEKTANPSARCASLPRSRRRTRETNLLLRQRGERAISILTGLVSLNPAPLRRGFFRKVHHTTTLRARLPALILGCGVLR